MQDFIEKIAFCIKTFERPDCVKKLVKSIKKFYPKAKIYIADDSVKPVKIKGIKVFQLPFDSGLSLGRNILVAKTDEPYLVFLDDDFIFTKETDIKKFFDFLEENKKYGIVCGALREKGEIRHYEGIYKQEKDKLYYCRTCSRKVDFGFNFFMARREIFNKVWWNPELKLGEHTDFFLTAKEKKINVYYLSEVIVEHCPERPDNYTEWRNRGNKFVAIMMKKRGLRYIIGFDNEVAYKISVLFALFYEFFNLNI